MLWLVNRVLFSRLVVAEGGANGGPPIADETALLGRVFFGPVLFQGMDRPRRCRYA